MFLELRDKENDFYRKYMTSLAARCACASSLIESEEDVDDIETSLSITNHIAAFEYLFEQNHEERLTPYMLPELIEKMTGGAYDNFRRTAILVEGSKQTRTLPRNIRMEMYTLFDNYYNVWSYLDDPYLREAKFHIKFLMIHPFGDGNGRCARLLTAYNLCNDNLPPVIITKDKKKEYCNYIENKDEEGLADFFREGSKKEQQVMLGIFRTCKIDYPSLEKRLQKTRTSM